MEVENIEAALTQAGEFLEREPPFNRHEKDAYSKAARAAFGYVKKARADGFSFVQICAALAKAGLLPREARPHSLRQAFYRECRKEKRNNELSKRILSGTETSTKTPVLPAKADTKKTDFTAAKPNIPAHGNSEEEKDKADRLRRETGKVVNTGLGIIVKHTDGSFDYD